MGEEFPGSGSGARHFTFFSRDQEVGNFVSGEVLFWVRPRDEGQLAGGDRKRSAKQQRDEQGLGGHGGRLGG